MYFPFRNLPVLEVSGTSPETKRKIRPRAQLAQGRMQFRGTTLVGCGMSCPAYPLWPDVAQAAASLLSAMRQLCRVHLSRTSAMRPFRSLLGSERCILASAGGLSAGDPPSLNGDAAGATLSVNALVEMIAQRVRLPRAIMRNAVCSARSAGGANAPNRAGSPRRHSRNLVQWQWSHSACRGYTPPTIASGSPPHGY